MLGNKPHDPVRGDRKLRGSGNRVLRSSRKGTGPRLSAGGLWMTRDPTGLPVGFWSAAPHE